MVVATNHHSLPNYNEMASLKERIEALSTRIGNLIRDNILPRLLPSGGAANQVLAKTSGTDYAVAWVNTASSGNMNQNFASGTGGTSIGSSETSIGTVTITPQSASSAILITARMVATKDSGTTVRTITARIKRSSTQIGLDCEIRSQGVATSRYGPAVITAIDSTHGTTSAITYTLYALCSSASASTSDDWEIVVVELMGAQGEKGDAGGELTDGDKGDMLVSSPGGITTFTIKNDVVSYDKIQNVVTDKRVLGTKSGNNTDIAELSASEVLDWIGSTRGSILYRGETGWEILAPGTAGRVLKTSGPGADPSWGALIDIRLYPTVSSNISATGSNQSTALALSAAYGNFIVVSTVPSGSGIKLPSPGTSGMWIKIINTAANTLNIYPETGQSINALSANAAITLSAGSSMEFISTSGTNYRTT